MHIAARGVKAPLIFLLAFLACVAIAAQAEAQRRQGRPRPPYHRELALREDTQNVTRVVLRNGLTLLVNEIRTAPLVSIVTYVKTSYADRSAPAAARLVQRAVLGTPSLRRELSLLGAEASSHLESRGSVLCLTAPSENFSRLLGAYAESITGAQINADALSEHLTALVGEAKLARYHAPSFIGSQLASLAFDAPVVSGPGSLDPDTVAALTVEKVAAFYRNFYRPNNVIIAISGDVDTERAVADSVRRFAGWQPAAAASEGRGEKVRPLPRMGFNYREARGDIARTYLAVGFAVPYASEQERYQLLLLSALLGLGRSSVLAQRLVDKLGLVDAVSAELHDFNGTALLQITARMQAQNLDKAELALFTELEALKQKGFEEWQVERALAQLEKDYYKSQWTLAGRAETLARFEAGGGFKQAERFVNSLRRIKPEDLAELLEKSLTLDRASVFEYQPSSAESRNFSAESLRSTIEQLLPASLQQRLAEKPPLEELIKVLKPSNENYKFQPTQIVGRGVVRASILRGPEVYVREEHMLPLISIGVFFPGGLADETEANSGITELMLRSMLRGTRTKSGDLIAAQIELWGGEIEPVVEPDCFGYLLTSLSKNAEDSLKLLFEALREAKFEPEMVEKAKQTLLADIAAEGKGHKERAVSLLRKALFQGHAYALPKHGLASAVSALDAEAVAAWHRARILKSKTVLVKPLVVISGDTQGTALVSLLARDLTRLDFEEVRLPEKAAPSAAGARAEERRQADVSVLALGFATPGAASGGDESYAIQVVRQALGGPGGRLDRLRYSGPEKLFYKLDLRFEENRSGGMLYFLAVVPAGREEEAAAQLKNELKELEARPLSEQELLAGAGAAIGRERMRLELPVALIKSVVRNVMWGRSYEEINSYAERIKSLAREDIRSVAESLLRPDRASLGAVNGTLSSSSETAVK